MLYSQAVPLSSLKIQEHVALAPYTTLQVGGAARFFVEAETEAEVVEAVGFARERGLPLFVLGGGSNLLVSDAGFDGVVLHIAVRGIREHREGDTVLVEAGAGENWNELVLYAVEHGYAGIECLAGIPGDVGGTPVQNVGAYGQEVSETIVRVRAYDLEASGFVDLKAGECRFAYRRSLFNSEARGRYIVTAVTYRLRPGGEPALLYADLQRHFRSLLDAGEKLPLGQVYDAVRSIREQKGMLAGQGGADGRSAGSFFKNPIVPVSLVGRVAATLKIDANQIPHWPAPGSQTKLAAAWLIEKAGFSKGFALGNAGISSRHTLALVNRGNATTAEIVALRDTIRERVHDIFGIVLEQEPVELGS
jgi:UDP-N-acetylmuramate dehydrogenase